MENEELKKIIEKNNSLIEEIFVMTKKINKYIFWSQIISWIKFFLILAPIIFAFIYLPPYLKEAFNSYNELLKP
jgi:hypothetical protein